VSPVETTLESAVPWLRLTLVEGVTPAAQRALLQTFGSAQAVLDASRGDIVAIVGPDIALTLAKGPQPRVMQRTLEWIGQQGHGFVTIADAAYPGMLREITDPPLVLYTLGEASLLNRQSLAVVGSRNATPGGTATARAFARALSDAGLTIVSGLALGIDAAAHRGGMEGRASSVAVIGTGIDVVYPRENVALAGELISRGCVVSEFPVGTPPVPGNFPRRNRIISGLARGVLVVEAARQSGSLITARSAVEQNRDVFAVPGSIHSSLSKGCHWLIREGAKLVEDAADVLLELGLANPATEAGRARAPRDAGECDPILEAMGFTPMSMDEISERCGLEAAALAARLSQLEIRGRVCSLPGGRFQQLK